MDVERQLQTGRPRRRGSGMRVGYVGWAVVLAIFGLAIAGSAWGDDVTVQDPQGDSFYCGAPTDPCPGDLDLKSATAGHRGSALLHTVEHYGQSPADTQIEIYTASTTVGRPDFYTWGTGQQMFDSNGNSVGAVGVDRPNNETITYEFDPQIIGSPASYRWRAVNPGEGIGPNGPADPAKVHDAAPDAPALATHSLGGGGGTGLPAPVIGRTVNVVVRSGVVLVRRPGARGFTRLQGSAQIPVRSFLDTTRGTVGLTSAANAQGATQSADFYSGQFQVLQTRFNPLTELRLSAGLGPCPRSSARGGGSALSSFVRRRRLWGRGRGRFRTRGRHSAATVRGTTWLVQDTCSGTLTRVTVGRVTVRDFVRGRTINLRAGQSYVARRAP
jgi:hypothetical protein